MRNHESKLQQSMIKWFRLQYPKYAGLLWACPNGGNRNLITAQILKAEGVLAGVADLFLAVPSRRGSYIEILRGETKIELHHGYFLEVKYDKGKQTESQIAFQKAVEEQGYKYSVVRSLEEFSSLIKEYFGN